MEYKPLLQGKNITVTHGKEDTVVVAGWLNPTRISDLVMQYGKHFAAIGNLYSQTPGVNFLVRNLLYNPQITHIIVIESTQQDKVSRSTEALIKFFAVGLNEEYRVKDFDLTCDIDREIPMKNIEELRRRIRLTVVRSLPLFAAALGEEVVPGKSTERLEFPPPSEPILDSYQLPKSGQGFKAKNPTEGWLKVLDYVSRFGVMMPNRFGGSTKECLAVNITIQHDDVNYPHFAPSLKTQCDEYIESFLSEDLKNDSSYSYAQRMRSHFGIDQIKKAIEGLTASPTARGIVINLWDSSADIISKEPPCLNHIWLRNSGGKLFMSATFRSHDMYAAWYSNVLALRALQHHVASKVSPRLDVGELTVISDSAHIYDHNYNTVELLIDQHLNTKESFNDPIGNMVISVSDKIYVDWLSSTGKKFYSFSGRRALVIGRDIYSNIPHIDPAHLMYLGVELNKAEYCLNKKLKYNQDVNITN